MKYRAQLDDAALFRLDQVHLEVEVDLLGVLVVGPARRAVVLHRLIALPGVGPEVAGQLLTTVGDNPDRLHSEAASAHRCGIAPIPASSGRTHRDRLNYGGGRTADNAFHIVVPGRLRHDALSRAYAARRTSEGAGRRRPG